MGMSKSGTTLVAKTLHHSDINMSPAKTGDYKQTKYEDPFIIKILLEMFQTNRLQSLFIPDKIKFTPLIQHRLKDYFSNKNGDWGFKQPWITLCYPEFKKVLPEHVVIGIKRSPDGLISHWAKRRKKIDTVELLRVQKIYNELMYSYGIPILEFEHFIKYGPVELEKILRRKLKDVRV